MNSKTRYVIYRYLACIARTNDQIFKAYVRELEAGVIENQVSRGLVTTCDDLTRAGVRSRERWIEEAGKEPGKPFDEDAFRDAIRNQLDSEHCEHT